MSTSTGTWTTVGALADLTPGEGRTYVVDGRQVAVFLLTDGTLRATDAICPHKGGPLTDGQIDGTVVICPLHQYAFSLDTGTCADGIGTVRVYEARIAGEEIQVGLPGER
ncbi:Rieske (2Fe-2S) protein [Aldersonia kunmingensis]|uniref:Rieske (2Fe-2S) protein n=1 Tax=Aldersonia kunmingensis TaxID=408066 RepID=UPI00082D51E7|nr:Rieske (2Fe-2S) protein [Aldersonia kunmingensis]